MPDWSEDFSQHNLKEVVRLQEENRAWQRELRTNSAAIVNSRLAKQISPEEYTTKRQVVKDSANECKRRGGVLAQEVWTRQRMSKRTIPDVN